MRRHTLDPSGAPVPLDASVAGFSAQSAFAPVAEHASAQARWHDGSETSPALSFATAGDRACAVLQPNRPIDHRAQLPTGSLAEQYGIQGFDVSTYDSFGVGVELSLAPTGAWGGTVTVTDYAYPNCSSAPTTDPNPPGGSSSPGCPGATPHQVAQLTLAP